jgi:thiol:disulfide interchange protein DsbD
MSILLRIIVALVLAAVAVPAQAAESAAVASPQVVATLISDTDRIALPRPFKVALRLRIAPGWHTYWRNPGDGGVAPDLRFTLAEGATAGPVAWPAPERQPEGPLMTYGYTGEVLLAVPITGAADVVALHASWLVCKEICIPEQGDFRLDLPIGVPAPSAEAPLFAAAEAALPRASPWTAEVAPDGTLTLIGEGISPATVHDAVFIPDAGGTVNGPAAQPLRVGEGRFTLSLTPGEAFRADAPLAGVLLVRDSHGGQGALAVSAAPGGPPAVSDLPAWQIIGFAVLGGLILNLMPCVFPVLAVKAVGLAGLSGARQRQAVGLALSYLAGVEVTFLLVGTVLLALRAAGDAVGWGFQFQSPAFVAGIAWVLFAVGLNLSGVYQVNLGAAGAGQSLAMRGGHAGSFFTGLLAVLVATPCTAPFMGVAIGAALTAGSGGQIMAVFLALGFGLALPYVVLAAVPAFTRSLPRPGRWMDVLRGLLAFPLYASCAWLLWVMSLEGGSAGVVAIASGLVLVGFAAWAVGLAQGELGASGRRTARSCALAATLAAMAVLSGIAANPPRLAGPGSALGEEPFSADRLAALRHEGRPVFVNMTAAWCVTCLVNERVALAQPEVVQSFAAGGVVRLTGDWTRQDAAITQFLHSFRRDGVPLYVLYPPGQGAPVVLPQILTEAEVLAALRGIASPPGRPGAG